MDDLVFLWKDITSGANGCPAIVQGDGGYYIIGKIPTAETRARVQAIAAANNAGCGADEDVRFVPANVLDRFRGQPRITATHPEPSP